MPLSDSVCMFTMQTHHTNAASSGPLAHQAKGHNFVVAPRIKGYESHSDIWAILKSPKSWTAFRGLSGHPSTEPPRKKIPTAQRNRRWSRQDSVSVVHGHLLAVGFWLLGSYGPRDKPRWPTRSLEAWRDLQVSMRSSVHETRASESLASKSAVVGSCMA